MIPSISLISNEEFDGFLCLNSPAFIAEFDPDEFTSKAEPFARASNSEISCTVVYWIGSPAIFYRENSSEEASALLAKHVREAFDKACGLEKLLSEGDF